MILDEIYDFDVMKHNALIQNERPSGSRVGERRAPRSVPWSEG